MRRAIELAERGRGRVSPNPLVGAVLVRDDEVIGEGHHAELGGAHAEVAAIEDARSRGNDPTGSTMFVSLEPCAHHGRTPPCAEAILAAGVGRVEIGSDDPSEKAAGRGAEILRDGGVEVEFANGDVAASARLQNQPFRKHARTGRPHVTYKAAISLDGRVGTPAGDSKWISGERSRALVHRWRSETDAICVGIGTALADDPLLTARDLDPPPARQPTRVVFDAAARLPLDSSLVGSVDRAPLLVYVAPDAPPDRTAALSDRGAEVIPCESEPDASVVVALNDLGIRGIMSLMLEGGPTLAASFLDAGEIDRMQLFVAPLVLGDDATPLFAGASPERIAEARRALSLTAAPSGEDILLDVLVREW